MIDEPDEPGDLQQSGELLLYDYFKHLTSLSLLSLGGVLALAEKARGTDSFVMLVGVMAMIGLAAVGSFSGASEIVRGRYRGTPISRQVGFYRVASPSLLALGVGGFIYLFAKTMVAA